MYANGETVTKITNTHNPETLKALEERKRYLIGMSELEASQLPSQDYYDRCRFLRQIEAFESWKRNARARDELEQKLTMGHVQKPKLPYVGSRRRY